MKYHLILSRAQWANENKSLGYQTTQALFLEKSMGGGVWQGCPRDGQQINDQRTEFTELSFVDCSSSSQFYLTETCVKHLLDGSVTYNAD